MCPPPLSLQPRECHCLALFTNSPFFSFIGNVSPLTGELVKPAYGGDNEAFLMKVVKPIYDVIAKVSFFFFL